MRRMRYTVADIAEKLEIDIEAARGLIKFLVEIGVAALMGERRPANGMGRAQNVYQFKDDFESLVAKRLQAGKLNE